MKRSCSVAVTLGLYCLLSATSTSAFVVGVAEHHTTRCASDPSTSRTALFDSRHRQKVASRTKWLESRGMADTTADTTESGTAEAGIFTNEGGLEYVKLVHPDSGASSEIYLYGGCVTSFCDGDGTEFIAVRPDAKMDGSKPISGGLSHCWPQFGPGEIQQHGFARNVMCVSNLRK